MLKGLHLLAALLVIGLLVIYFCLKSQDYNTTSETVENIIASDVNISPYSEFCANNKDVKCGDINNFITDSYKNEEYGKILEDTYKIYFDIDVPVTDTMIIRRVGEAETYTINGSPSKYHTLIPHIKVNVQKQRKPLKLE